ncbi:MAG: gamma-glutamylcyclotransferase [Minwuiales bacterium]|nr:gamma-glutamylcyclotransferase [Minwuiales bacterium]
MTKPFVDPISADPDAVSKPYDDPGLTLPDGELWVFGYGSLMWRPGIDYLEAAPAVIHGFHRALCVWSWYHRGSEAAPGLVMGLDLGGSCRGRAYRIAAENKATVVDYLYRREMVTPVYRPRLMPARIDERTVSVLMFTVDRDHPQYAGKLSVETAAGVVVQSQGHSGHNRDYIVNMVEHLDEEGIHDAFLRRLRDEISPG